jgi:hypothetical protein
VLYGVYAFTPLVVNFNPKVLHPSLNQSAVPFYAVPDDDRSHTYKVVFHLATDVTTTTSYKLNDRKPVTVACSPGSSRIGRAPTPLPRMPTTFVFVPRNTLHGFTNASLDAA